MSQRIIKRRETSFESSQPRRGEIYWADLTDEVEEKRKDRVGKVRKKEAQKDRPVVILSNDKQNKYSDEVIIALISSQLDKVYYFEPEISLKKPSKILTDQILTIDKERLEDKIASLSAVEMIKLEKALHAVLSLRTWCRQRYGEFTPETWQLLQLLTKKEGISVSQLLERALECYDKYREIK